MNVKFLSAVLGIALSATAISASAQKKYTEGTATFEGAVNGQTTEAKVLFKGDTSATNIQQGPAQIKIIRAKDTYLVVVVDVPVANLKKAAVATPAELEETYASLPTLTFTPTTETKQINGFNCKRVVTKDSKSNSTFDTWVTNDIEAPLSVTSDLYSKAGGFPVQFTVFQKGIKVVNTLKSISENKVPAGSFSVPAGYDRITLTDLNSMGGGR